MKLDKDKAYGLGYLARKKGMERHPLDDKHMRRAVDCKSPCISYRDAKNAWLKGWDMAHKVPYL
jgi:hypothetical protein